MNSKFNLIIKDQQVKTDCLYNNCKLDTLSNHCSLRVFTY